MIFALSYSKKILSRRQKAVLYGSIFVCVVALVYTYLATEYFVSAMEVSIADLSPHVRVYSSSQQESLRIVEQYKHTVAKIDSGVLYEGNFVVRTRYFEEKKGFYYNGVKELSFIGYSFEDESYRPPVFLENVYSASNKRKTLSNPQNEPVRIVADQDEKERRVNYVIISKGLTSIIENGASPFLDRLEVCKADSSEKMEGVVITTAGHLMSSPLDMNPYAGRSDIYTKRSVVEKIAAGDEVRQIVDISLGKRRAALKVANEIKSNFPDVGVETWISKNPQAVPVLDGIRLAAYAGVLSIALLAILGMAFIFRLIILEKTRQLAVLFSMGYHSRKLRVIFGIIALRIGFYSVVFGGITGGIMAKLSVRYWQELAEKFSGGASTDLVYSWPFLFWASLGTILFCFAAAWLPSRAIVKADPITNLRGE